MGSRRENSASGRSLTYIYKDGDTRSWLVSALSAANADASWWLDDDLALISAGRALEFKTQDLLFKRNIETNSYNLHDPETSTDIPLNSSPADVTGFLSDIAVTDIQRDLSPSQAPISQGYLKTYDGLTLSYHLYMIDGQNWLKIHADFDPDARDTGEAGILEGSPENGEQEAKDINQKTDGWLFAISQADADMLLRGREFYLNSDHTEPEK
jgi:hypothetical protein